MTATGSRYGVTFYNCDHQQMEGMLYNCDRQQMEGMLYNCDRQQIGVTFNNCDNQQIGVTLYNCDHSQTKLASDQSHVTRQMGQMGQMCLLQTEL